MLPASTGRLRLISTKALAEDYQDPFRADIHLSGSRMSGAARRVRWRVSRVRLLALGAAPTGCACLMKCRRPQVQRPASAGASPRMCKLRHHAAGAVAAMGSLWTPLGRVLAYVPSSFGRLPQAPRGLSFPAASDGSIGRAALMASSLPCVRTGPPYTMWKLCLDFLRTACRCTHKHIGCCQGPRFSACLCVLVFFIACATTHFGRHGRGEMLALGA